MKKKIFGLALLLGTLLSACGPAINSSEVTSSSSESSSVSSTESSVESTSSVSLYEGTKTVAPYTSYNQDGSIIGEYPSMYQAIHYAGVNGKSTNKAYVFDGNGFEIFRRQAKNMYFMYEHDHYVGTALSTTALAWAENKPFSYVLDGFGVSYVKLGKVLMEGSTEPENFELFSGGYTYMTTKQGLLQGGDWVQEGYAYASVNVRLSEATYMPSQDGDGWNAYIFLNHRGAYNSDLGLIGNLINGKVVWRLVRNCSFESHKPFGDNFKVLSTEAVTTMELDENGVYSGADDLHFEAIATVNGWTLHITNLRTNQVFTIDEQHEGFHTNSTPYFRFLLAASYCPVVGDVWNARSGAFLKNVVFTEIQVARYDASNDYSKVVLEDFYPGDSSMDFGFTQAADTASFKVGTYENAGVYQSGNSYAKGDKYLSFSSYYDGSNGWE